MQQNPAFYVLWVLGVLTAFLTAFYMFRLWFMTFCGEPRSHEAEHAHESPKIMTVPLMILAVFATVSGLVILFNFGEVVVPVNVFTMSLRKRPERASGYLHIMANIHLAACCFIGHTAGLLCVLHT